MLGDDSPESAGVRSADGFALVKNGCVPVEKRTIDDVRVTDNPAYIGGRPKDLTRLHAVDALHAPRERSQMPTIIANHAFGNTRGTGRVEDVEWVGRGNRNTIGRLRLRHQFRPVEIASGDH